MTDFNIKSVVDFLEKNGYRVRAVELHSSFPEKMEAEVSRSINAALSLREVVSFIDAIGFTVKAAKEIWEESDGQPALYGRLMAVKVLFSAGNNSHEIALNLKKEIDENLERGAG